MKTNKGEKMENMKKGTKVTWVTSSGNSGSGITIGNEGDTFTGFILVAVTAPVG
jgi:hypothetical protein